MLIGREKEQEYLRSAFQADRSRFIAVYGRRRVGKTFLIRETFDYSFTFEHANFSPVWLNVKNNRLWNGGNGWGIIRLYDKVDGELRLVDEVEATHIGYEYGEYDED